jgi:hypothetical protein
MLSEPLHVVPRPVRVFDDLAIPYVVGGSRIPLPWIVLLAR